ncbi:hypothetical protein ACROYT_G005033 [Oculina patagonica]
MELEIYQVAILLTTLFSGSDARPAASRQTSMNGLQSTENQLQEYRQEALIKRPLVENVLKSSTERKAVLQRLERGEKLRKELFFPSKKGRIIQKRETITQKKLDYLAKFSQRKVTSKFNAVRSRKVLRRLRRYAAQGSKWSSREITWNIVDWSVQLSNNDVNNTLTKALRIWAEVSPLVFRWVDPPTVADIAFKFVTGNHGDVKAFDGPGNAVAHAFYPDNGGDIHFDDDENWTIDFLLPTAVHEIGHSLGLRHSNVPGSVMTSFTTNLNSKVVLSDDDVNGIRSIYGYCRPTVTAIEYWMGDGRTYIFNGGSFWRLNDAKDESERGYPKTVNPSWGNVPDDIDEVFLWGHNWNTYFFKGHMYYKYNDDQKVVETNYPRNISQGWPGLPADGIDAGFTWSKDRSYFFKGDQVYLYDNINDQVAFGYPRPISEVWPGLPNNIDSVFLWYYDGVSYFFKGHYYYWWDDVTHVAKGPFFIGKTEWKNVCKV